MLKLAVGKGGLPPLPSVKTLCGLRGQATLPDPELEHCVFSIANHDSRITSKSRDFVEQVSVLRAHRS